MSRVVHALIINSSSFLILFLKILNSEYPTPHLSSMKIVKESYQNRTKIVPKS